MTAFKYVGGMVGNPDLPAVEWSDEQMQTLKDMGMNFAQLNIAWNGRPGNEPLNLDHMDDEMIKVFQYRVAQLKKFGMKGMPHFGMPRMLMSKHDGNITPYMTPACILEDETMRNNWAMMEKTDACLSRDRRFYVLYVRSALPGYAASLAVVPTAQVFRWTKDCPILSTLLKEKWRKSTRTVFSGGSLGNFRWDRSRRFCIRSNRTISA